MGRRCKSMKKSRDFDVQSRMPSPRTRFGKMKKRATRVRPSQWLGGFRAILIRIYEAFTERQPLLQASDSLLFCELERRRVLSVNATFLSGVLSIDIQPGLDPSIDSAALIVGSDSSSFLVDTNGNGQGDIGEVTGNISDLERLVVDGTAGYGSFGWYGDFRSANFEATPLASINIRGLDNVTLAANVDSPGFLTVRNISGPVQLGGSASYAGEGFVGSLQLGHSANIVSITEIFSGPNSTIIIGEDARFESVGSVMLAQAPNDVLQITGHTQIMSGTSGSPQAVLIGAAGTVANSSPLVDLNRLSVRADSLTLFETNDIELDQVVTNQLQMHAGGSIHDRVVANISIENESYFEADSLNLSIGQFNAGTLEFRVASDAVVYEQSGMDLTGIIQAASVDLRSTASIGDTSSTEIQISGNAQFVAADEITLADSTFDTLSVSGHSQFTAGDTNVRSPITLGTAGTISSGSPTVDINELSLFGSQVTLFDENNLVLNQVDVTGLQISINGNLLDSASSNINIAGQGQFSANAISLASGAFNSQTLQFQTTLDVTISEGSDTNLVGTNSASNIKLTSAGNILDVPNTTITATQDLQLIAAGDITLAQTASNLLNVNNHAVFQADADISIGGDQINVNFGTLSLYGQDVQVNEASSMLLVASSLNTNQSVTANQLNLRSVDQIAQESPIVVAGDSEFQLRNSGDMLLARSAASGALMDNAFAGDIIFESDLGILGGVAIRDISQGGARRLGSAAADFSIAARVSSLEVLLPFRSLEFSNSGIEVLGNAQVIVGKDGDPDFLTTTELNRTITDADGATLNVDGNLRFITSGDIVLADQTNNQISVAGTFTAISDLNVRVGSSTGGQVNLGQVNVRAEDLELFETESTELNTIQVANLIVNANGQIVDTAGASIDVLNDATLRSLGEILLADSGVGDRLVVGGSLSAIAVAQNLPGGDLRLAPISLGSANIGTGLVRTNILAEVRLGNVSLVGSDVRLSETDATYIRQAIATSVIDSQLHPITQDGNLTIASGDSIQNIMLDGSSGAGHVFSANATLDSGTWIVLEQSEVQQLSFAVGSNLNPSGIEADYLRDLRNPEAVQSSESVFGDIQLAFTRNSPEDISLNAIDPASLTELADRFDFEVTLLGQYALQVRNQGELEITGGNAVGDQLNIYVETLTTLGESADLVVSGPILFAQQGQAGVDVQQGGVVLVAGDSLQFEAGGGVIAERFEVYHTNLNSSAFQGGEGIGSNLSTARVLPPEASQQDPLTQHFEQQIASVFGNRSAAGVDLGFQHVVAYADGSYQYFDVRDSTETGTADLLIRNGAFDTNFLTSWGSEQLPTSVVFRRAEGLFMYESGGQADVAAQSFSATAASDFVNDVFVGTADPPLPPIPQPAPPPETLVVAPTLILPEAPRATQEISNSLEVRSVSENVREIVIVAVQWIDLDRTPQNARLDLNEFQQLEIEAGEKGAGDFLAERKGDIVQLRGDRKIPNNATDEQLEDLIEDIQRDPLAFLDELGQPLFVEPVYGIVELDAERGETLWRMFMVRPDLAEPLIIDANEQRNSMAPTEVDSAEPQALKNSELQDESSLQNTESLDEKPTNAEQVEEIHEGEVDAMLLTPAMLLACKQLQVQFDRASRASRRMKTVSNLETKRK